MHCHYKLFMHLLECYFGVYIHVGFATQEINMKITLLLVNKLFATPVQISFSICMIQKKREKINGRKKLVQ